MNYQKLIYVNKIFYQMLFLLLEHNISELESRSLAEENTNSFGRTR